MGDRHHFVLVVLVLVIVLLIHVEPIIFCIFKILLIRDENYICSNL